MHGDCPSFIPVKIQIAIIFIAIYLYFARARGHIFIWDLMGSPGQPLSRPQHLLHHRQHVVALHWQFQFAGSFVKRITGPAQRKLLGCDPALGIRHQRVQVAQRTQASQGAVGCAHQADNLAAHGAVAIGPDRVTLDRAADPVNGVFQQAGVGAVVLG